MGELILGPGGGAAEKLLGRKLSAKRGFGAPLPAAPQPQSQDQRRSQPVSQGGIPAQAFQLNGSQSHPRPDPDVLADVQAEFKFINQAVEADMQARRFESAACRLQGMADLYERVGDHLGAYHVLEKSAELQFEQVGAVDAGTILAADELLRAASLDNGMGPAADSERPVFDARWQKAIHDVWESHHIPSPLPVDWRDALDNPTWREPLSDVKGLKAAQRRLEQDGNHALEKSHDLLKQGEAKTAVKAKQMAGEIFLRANKELQAGTAFLEAGKMSYERLEVLSPDLFLKAERALRDAARHPETAVQAREQLEQLSKTVNTMLDRLWAEQAMPSPRPAQWQAALRQNSLYPFFFDVHGRKEAAFRRDRADEALTGKTDRGKSIWQKTLDGARTIYGVVEDNADKYLIDPLKVAYHYYTDPHQRKHFLQDAGYVGRAGLSVAASAGKAIASPFEEAYSYYTAPDFSLKKYAHDVKTTGSAVAAWWEGEPAQSAPPINPARRPISAKDMQYWVTSVTGKPITKNRLQLYVDGREAVNGVMDLIHDAQKSINIEMFMFHNDQSGYQVADALIAKAKKGVKVRVLYDKLGTWLVNSAVASTPGSKGNIVKYLRDNGVEVLEQKNTDLDSDHTKLIVVDGKSAITGGMNFGNHYTYEWHDFMIRVDGPAVAEMQRSFVETWHRAQGKNEESAFPKDLYYPPESELVVAGGVSSSVLLTAPGKREIKDAMFEAVRHAKHHINVEHGYLTDDAFVNELIKARQRGVQVRIILPTKSDSSIYDRSNLVSLNRLVAAGAECYLYSRTIHGKVITVDGVWGTIGSANASRRSFDVNQELNIGIFDPHYIRLMDERIFETDLHPDRSKPVLAPIKRGTWDEILDWGARKASQMAEAPKDARLHMTDSYLANGTDMADEAGILDEKRREPGINLGPTRLA